MNSEAKKWKNLERKKFTKKATHLKEIKEKEKIRELEKCPQEKSEFESLSIFDKNRIDAMVKEKVVVSSIGDVELDDDEIALLSLPPEFALRKRLISVEMKTDAQMGMAKVRFQLHKEELAKDYDDNDDIALIEISRNVRSSQRLN